MRRVEKSGIKKTRGRRWNNKSTALNHAGGTRMKLPRTRLTMLPALTALVLWTVLTVIPVLVPPTLAGETPPDNLYSGDFLTRPTLTGDWGGFRNELAGKGVTFDASLTQIEQGITNGGKERDWEYGGRYNLTTNIDTGKLGLWPGGFITVELEGNFNHSVNSKTGTAMPVDSSQSYPSTVTHGLNVPAVSITQFLSKVFGVFMGKLDTTSGDANEFAHGKGDRQFFNLSLNFNPIAALTTPYSALGAGIIIFPTGDPKAAVISIMAYDGDGTPSTTGFHTALKSNTAYAAEGRVRTDLFGRTGHQLLGAVYSSKTFNSITQDMRIFTERLPIAEKNGSWALYYNFDQYLYEVKKGSGAGIGIFGRFGLSDGDPNPIHHFYSLGIGGQGVIPGRKLDSFGLGCFYINVAHPKLAGAPVETKLFRDEKGLEIYYNTALTPWMRLTPDLQVVRTGQKRFLNNGVVDRINTVTTVGIRLQLIL